LALKESLRTRTRINITVEYVTAPGPRNWNDGAVWSRKKFDDALAVWIECMSVTDRRTDTGRRLLARSRIASRGNNWMITFFIGENAAAFLGDCDAIFDLKITVT